MDSSFTRDAYFAIARECRKRRVPFAGHVPPAVTAEEASRAGQASIEHLGGHHLGVLLSCSRREAPLVDAARRIVNTAIREAWAGREPDSVAPLRVGFTRPVLESFDPRRAAALFARFKRRRTWQTPTLVTLQRLLLLDADPLKDVTNVRAVAAVVVRGRLLRGDELARLRQDDARQQLGPGRVQAEKER